MKKRKPVSKTIHIGKSFLILFIFLLIASLVVKVAMVYKDNKFDGNSRINILAKKNNFIVSFSPQTNTAVIVRALDKKPIEEIIQVPIDAHINSNFDLDRKSTFWNLEKLITADSNLTIFDYLRLAIYVQSLSDSEIEERVISDKLSESELKTIALSNFIDPQIGRESLSIEIVNGTEKSGLGNRIANEVINAGGDVVMVSNSFQKEKESKILFSEKETYTIKKLSKIYKLKKVNSKEKGIGDVKIILGGDFSYVKF